MSRWLPVLVGLLAMAFVVGVVGVARVARADGVMVVGERELFREGSAARGYCQGDDGSLDIECERVLTKVLSGYSYARGQVSGGLVDQDHAHKNRMSGVLGLRISWMAADLPGGALSAATFDGVIGDAATSRMRLTLMDAEGLWACRDAQTGVLVAPVLGMFTRNCVPHAWLGVDAGLFAMQWDVARGRLAAEWLHFGPAFELLANGFGYAHLLHSIELALPFDLRSVHSLDTEQDVETTLGVGVRLSAFYRSPDWEARLLLRQRTSLLGAEGVKSDNSFDGELRLLYNFFLSDSVVLQTGLSFRASWAQKPENTFVVWASADDHFGAFAGVHVGWVHEAPDI